MVLVRTVQDCLCVAKPEAKDLNLLGLVDASLWRFSRHVQLGSGPGADPERAGGITYPVWPWGPPGAAAG